MPSRRNGEAIARLGLRELRRRGPHDGPACTRIVQRNSSGGVVAGTRGVPPVGVEPTLGTLLGGRPLPLGYGGAVMIPPRVRTILAQPNGGRKIRPGAHIQFECPDPRMRSVTNLPGLGRNTHTA